MLGDDAIVKKVEIVGDVSESEWENIHLPIQQNLERYMAVFIVPEVIAFSIADAYNRGGLCDSTFESHYRSMGDILLVKPHLMEVADQIFEILKIKYGLVIVDDNPMKIEKVYGDQQ